MNWFARPQGSNFFKREWLKKADRVPSGSTKARAWDKGSTEPSDVTPHPDFTACCGMAKSRDGDYYIFGNFHPDNIDDKISISGKFRKRPGPRDRIILKQAQYDGEEVRIVQPLDPGQAGASEFRESSKKLVSEGFVVRKDPKPPRNSKLTKFEPFSAACENGDVYIVEDSFNKPTLEAFYKELEAFNGERSGKLRKDD